MAVTKQLAQAAGTAADAVLYTPDAGKTAANLIMIVCNTDAAASYFSIYQDDDGAVHTAATALYFQTVIAANTTVRLLLPPMTDAAGNISVACETDADCTFTLQGTEMLLA